MSDHIPRTNIDELPSLMKSYPQNLQFQTRPYTVGEMRQMAGDLPPEEIYKIILKGIFVSGGKFDRTKLTVQDVSFIAMLRKVLTLGDKGEVVVSTVQRGVTYKASLKYNEVKFKPMQAEDAPITVDVLGGRENVVFNPPTIGAYLKSLKFFPDIKGSEGRKAVMLAAMLGNPQTEDEFRANLEFIDGLAGEDRLVIDEIDEQYDHGVEDIEVSADPAAIEKAYPEGEPEGGYPKVKVSVPLTAKNLGFFRPEGGTQSHIKSRLRFG